MSTTHNYFDLLAYIRDVKNVDVASQMAQSLAFRIDVNIQAASRTLFKLVRDDQHEKLKQQNIDNLADLTAALGEAAFAERCFNEVGNDAAGPVTIIKELLAIREEAHEMAAELTAFCIDWQGNPRRYDIPDLDDRFYEPPKLKVSELERTRAEKGMARRAEAYGLSKQEADELLQRKMKRKEDSLRDVETTLTNQARIVHVMFNIARSADLDVPAGENFHSMDLAQQRLLIDAVIKAAERAEEFAERDRSLSEAQYDDICINVMRVVKDLRAVLASPRFRTDEFRREAAAVNVG